MANAPRRMVFSALWLTLIATASCGGGGQPWKAPVAKATVVQSFPHDTGAFTQGLLVDNGQFVESTGLVGRSSLRRVDRVTGNVLKKIDVPSPYFAEGLALLRGKLYQLTWQSGKGFVYDLNSFADQGSFLYSGEGWGLTTDGTSLILSDGTSHLRFLDPANFRVTKTIVVRDGDRELTQLNELEYIRGEVWANVWHTDWIVRIDPNSGQIVGVVDLRGLLPNAERTSSTDVLNGIAYDAAGDRLFVTGKLWPKVYEIRIPGVPTRKAAPRG